MTADRLNSLRALHSPSRADRYSPVCEGCDSEGWEAETPAWPCRTALLLWDDAERDAVLAEWRAWQATQPKPAPSSGGSLFIPAVWQQQLLQQLNRTPLSGSRVLLNLPPESGQRQ